MKQINLFKKLLFASLLGVTTLSQAQIHPLSFGSYTIGTLNTGDNWYGSYVGMRFQVDSPTSVAGTKASSYAYSGTTPWGGAITTPIVNVPVAMGTGADSTACSSFPAGYLTGKIALVWRTHVSGVGCEFGYKALQAQNAGAIACVIMNDVPGEGPVGMAAGASGATVTIPVFMIGNLDGLALSAAYHSLPAGTHMTMTITPWGQGLNNDLGFVPGGAATWHNYAIPANQLGTTGNPTEYNMIDGAFIANFGLNPQTGVKLKSTTTFTPTGGSPASIHTSEVDLTGSFYSDATHPTADSIMAMFKPASEYSLSSTGTGRFDVNYIIEQDAADDYPADNSLTMSFYATDSIFSKGSYNFSNNTPNRTIYYGGGSTEFIWGPMYYSAKAGTSISSVQYGIAMAQATAGYPHYNQDGNFVYVFKWNDGTVGGLAADSVVQNGELELVGMGYKTYNILTDTSEVTMWCQISSNLSTLDPSQQVPLEANTWYYVAVDIVSSTADPLYLGCDGNASPYPRVYGRFHNGSNLMDYNNMQITPDYLTAISDSLQGNAPITGMYTNFINSIDSGIYAHMIGLVPAVSMATNNEPNSVKPSPVKPIAEVSMFPNPATDAMTVNASFEKTESVVTYEVIDGLARFVSKEQHHNVKNDSYTINTSKLAAGNYYLMINAGGRAMAKKFVVVK